MNSRLKSKSAHSGWFFFLQEWHFKTLIFVDRQKSGERYSIQPYVIAKQYVDCFFCVHQAGDLIDLPGRGQTKQSMLFSAPVCPNKTTFFGLGCSSVDCKVRVHSPDSFLVLEMLSVVIFCSS